MIRRIMSLVDYGSDEFWLVIHAVAKVAGLILWFCLAYQVPQEQQALLWAVVGFIWLWENLE